MASRPRVSVRRVYEDPDSTDGHRVLVDRVWPRGVSKERAALDEWCKAVAPSPELRKWFGHDPDRFSEFDRKYRAELDDPERAEALKHLRELARRDGVTLVTATKDVDNSAASVIARLLRGSRGK